MADRRHAVTQLDFFIRQVTLFADEIRNAVGQKLDVLGFKTTGRDLGEQMAFGFLLEFLQKVVVILCDRFACHRIQRLGKILLGETVCIRQALGQGLFHFIGKLPVRRMNLFASMKSLPVCAVCCIWQTDGKRRESTACKAHLRTITALLKGP